LPEQVYGYLNNPLLQENLSFIPLATCFDYAAAPAVYDPERSWRRIIRECFGDRSLGHWQGIREFCDGLNRTKDKSRPHSLPGEKRRALEAARRYIMEHRGERWFEEFRPWLELMEEAAKI